MQACGWPTAHNRDTTTAACKDTPDRRDNRDQTKGIFDVKKMRRGGSERADESRPPAPDRTAKAAPVKRLSTVRRLMDRFDDLPQPVRQALSSADAPSDQMVEVLCTMHESGFPVDALLKVIDASNAER